MKQNELIKEINIIIHHHLLEYHLLETNSAIKKEMIEWLIEFKTTRRLFAVMTDTQLVEIYEEIRKNEKLFDFIIQLTLKLRLHLGEEIYNKWIKELKYGYSLWEYQGIIDEETYLRMPKEKDLETLLKYPWYVSLLTLIVLNVDQSFIQIMKIMYDE